MKFKQLLSLSLILLFILSSIFLTAQTYKQQVESTNIISALFDGKLKFNPKKTNKISTAGLRKVLKNNPFTSAKLQNKIYTELVPKGFKNWRGVTAEATLDGCEILITIGVVYLSKYESGSELHIFLSPKSNCGKLVESKLPSMYRNPMNGAPYDNVAKFKECLFVNKKSGSVCANVVVLYTNSSGLSTTRFFDACENDSDCNQEDPFVIPFYTLTMEEKK